MDEPMTSPDDEPSTTSEPAPTVESDDAPERTPRNRLVHWLWIAAGVIVLVVAIIPLAFAFTPQANGWWGYTRPFYQSWGKDRHRATASTCLHCHLEPGARGIVTYPLTFWGGLLSNVSGGALGLPPTAFPSDRVCMRSGCHTTNRLTSPSGDLLVSHVLHAKEGARCITCHPGAGHNGAGGRKMRPTMEMCKECHADKMSDCSYCHVGRSLQGTQTAP